MINEILYMEIRLIRTFCQKYKITHDVANEIFIKYNIWQYIESCYDSLHLNGDEYNLEDISNMLKKKGAAI